MKPKSAWLRSIGLVLGGGILIILTVLLFYRPLWVGMVQADGMPWGSDTLGHLLRFDYIRRNIQADNWYPQIMPEWYMGMQLLRYYGPLPYYFLYLLEKVLGSPLAALHGFILFWTLWGGLSWLAFRRRLGTLPAILGGALYTLLPDLVRVTFSEGSCHG